MKVSTIVVGSLALMGLTGGLATAGNIGLTGHDDDFHCSFSSTQGCAQLSALVSFVRNGSGLKVLTFDQGSELTTVLTTLGIAFTNVDPSVAASVTDSLFNPATYSAFIVASDQNCGGCDNTAAGEANIATHSTAIGAFLNAGGGILGFAGATSANYYAFVPQTASSVGGAPSTGYSQTAVGLAHLIPAVNGDPTHNLFWDPGTHGESGFFQVAEVNATGNGTILGPNAASTLLCVNCTVTGGIIGGAPEPSTYVFMTGGLAGLAFLKKIRARLR